MKAWINFGSLTPEGEKEIARLRDQEARLLYLLPLLEPNPGDAGQRVGERLENAIVHDGLTGVAAIDKARGFRRE